MDVVPNSVKYYIVNCGIYRGVTVHRSHGSVHCSHGGPPLGLIGRLTNAPQINPTAVFKLMLCVAYNVIFLVTMVYSQSSVLQFFKKSWKDEHEEEKVPSTSFYFTFPQ